MDPAKLLQPNPFAGDDGGVQPAMAAALGMENPAERAEAIVAALASGRVFIPVEAHAHPGVDTDGAVQVHDISDPQQAAIDDAAGAQVNAPGGRRATPIFSSAAGLAAFDPAARPLPVWGRNIAMHALVHSGILALDPPKQLLDEAQGSVEQAGTPPKDAAFYVGRAAAAAVAAAEEWLAPWNDQGIVEAMRAALAGDLAAYGVEVQATSRGVVRIVLHVHSAASRESTSGAVQKVAGALAADPYLSARLDLVEIVPVRLA